MIAHYLKTKKPKSKLVILDPKKAFSKQPVFTEAFDKYYKGIIELNLTNEIDDFAVVSVDPKTKEIVTKAGKKVKADVANIIPQQRAGEIAVKAGCTEGDWCPINAGELRLQEGAERLRAGRCHGRRRRCPSRPSRPTARPRWWRPTSWPSSPRRRGSRPRYRNTCWSLLAPDDNVKIGANYAPKDGKLDPSGGFVSQRGETADVRKQNYQESIGWYAAITADMFAKPAPAPAATGSGEEGVVLGASYFLPLAAGLGSEP